MGPWREVFLALRFGLVGAAASVTHIVVVAIALSVSSLPAMIANTAGFLAAFLVSFAGNYYWTFRVPGNPRRALIRFILIAASAFAINSLILAVILHESATAPLLATVIAAAAVPLFTFLASRFWGFDRE